MNRMEFDSLNISEQVNYINENLKKGISLSLSAKEINISKSTLSDRLKRNGYRLLNGSYQKVDESAEKEIIKEVPKEKPKEELKVIIDRINKIEKELRALKSVPATKDIKHYDNTINKTFKVNKELLEQLEDKFKQYNNHKKQDILNTILEIGLSTL